MSTAAQMALLAQDAENARKALEKQSAKVLTMRKELLKEIYKMEDLEKESQRRKRILENAEQVNTLYTRRGHLILVSA